MKSLLSLCSVVPSFGARTAALCVATTVFASTAEAAVSINTQFTRYADSSGLGNILYQSVAIGGEIDTPVTAATRPNGQSNWGGGFSGYLREWGPSVLSGASDAEAIAWNEANAKGTWTFTSGGVTRSLDTTGFYKAESERTYLELTEQSANLWSSILANNLTGTFTFNLKSAATSGGFWYFGYGTSSQFSGFSAGDTSFTLTFTSEMTNGIATLGLLEGELRYFNGFDGDEIESSAQTIYTNDPAVPAPGAIALLGLAGLAGRRRR
jgi:MYXO-CTERM domain-containing protein